MPLNVYLRRHREIKEDTLEDLAASILWEAYGLKLFTDTNNDEAIKSAHELGGLEKLFLIYSEKDKILQKPRQPRRRAWAEELAKELVKGRPEASNEELWIDISEEEVGDLEIYAGGRRWYVYRDDERLWAYDADDEFAARQKGPAYRSFAARYLTEARKPIRC